MKIVALFPYNFTLPNFEQVFWGDPERELWGRGPTAIKEFFESDAQYLLIGGGGVLVDHVDDGEDVSVQESIVEYVILCQRLSELRFPGSMMPTVKALISEEACVIIDRNYGKNTETVAIWVRDVFNRIDNGDEHNEVIVVADPAHLRALQCTQATFKDLIPRVKVVFVPSDIPYAGEPGDAVIFEAPALEKPGVRDQLQGIIDDMKKEPSIATVGRTQK